MMDPQGCISYWNPAARRIFGYTSDEALGRNLHEMLAPQEYHAACDAAFPRFHRDGVGNAIGKTLELEACRKDGTLVAVALSLSAMQIGGKWHAVGIVRDESQRKQAELALKENHAFLETLLNAIPAPVFYKDADGRYLGCNKAFEEFYGKTVQDLRGRDIFDLAPPEVARFHEAKDRQLLQNSGRRRTNCK